MHERDLSRLAQKIKQWGRELGFAAVGIADGELSAAEAACRMAGSAFMARWIIWRRTVKRSRPGELVPGTSASSARWTYFPPRRPTPTRC
jgi:epoxyqueuosine reductase